VGEADKSGHSGVSHDGIICTGETYKSVVKLTFARTKTPHRHRRQRGGASQGAHPHPALLQFANDVTSEITGGARRHDAQSHRSWASIS
jgi:hypothetical protein